LVKRQQHSTPAEPVWCPLGTRRRGEILERAIFDAVLAELAEVGYDALTMEGAAGRAHTGKAALYRRWSSKQALVLDALHRALPPVDDPPDTGSVRGDLLAFLGRMADTINSPTGAAMQAVVGHLKRHPDIAQAVQARVIEPRRRLIMDALRRGADRGEVRPDAVTRLVAEVGPALIVHKFMTQGPPIPKKTVRAIVDEVIMPILRP